MHFVLVSAANANDLMLNKSFYYCVQPRLDHLLGTYRGKDDLVVTWFEVTSGLCRQMKMDRRKQRSKWATLERFAPVTRSNYERLQGGVWGFRDGQPDVMSIVNIYRFVQKQEAQSVFELSVFCHSWEEGPVLVNSYDDGWYKDASGHRVRTTDQARDPDDKDGRPKDFEPVNMDLPKFRAALNPDGAIRNWGCTYTDRDVDLFEALFAHKDYRQRGMKDSQALALRVPGKWDVEFNQRLLPVKDGKIECTFGELRSYFDRELTSCYAAKAAKGANVKAYGGAPGTGSTVGGRGGTPMYIVSRPGRNLKTIEFYKTYMGVTFNEAHYAEFAP